MGEMSYLLIGAPPIGYIVHNIDDISCLPDLIRNSEPPRSDIALAQGLALPRAYIENETFGALQGFLVVGGDGIRSVLGEKIDRCLANDLVARHPKLRLCHPIDQDVTAIAHVLDSDLSWNVV